MKNLAMSLYSATGFQLLHAMDSFESPVKCFSYLVFKNASNKIYMIKRKPVI